MCFVSINCSMCEYLTIYILEFLNFFCLYIQIVTGGLKIQEKFYSYSTFMHVNKASFTVCWSTIFSGHVRIVQLDKKNIY